jgi:hypothetical protein
LRQIVVLCALLLSACGTAASPGAAVGPAASVGPGAPAQCPASVRAQSEIAFAGLPPLVPTGPLVKCVLNATVSSSAYDAGYNQQLELRDGRGLQLYERRGSMPVKDTPSQILRSGGRDINGVQWTWAVLANGATTLSVVTQGTYVELAMTGDEKQIDALAEVAGALQPVETLPRPSATQLCAPILALGNSGKVAAAFDSSAASVVVWHETQTPGGPRPTSEWRQHPPNEPVAVCYLDGDFGSPRGPAPPSGGATRPNYDRVVYVAGVDRRPIAVVFGWQDRIAIRDPGP